MRKIYKYECNTENVTRIVDQLFRSWFPYRMEFEELLTYLSRCVMISSIDVIKHNENAAPHLQLHLYTHDGWQLNWYGSWTDGRFIKIRQLGLNLYVCEVCVGNKDDRHPRDSAFLNKVLYGVELRYEQIREEEEEE